MNFIFDIGNVLVDYKPELFLREFLRDEADENKMLKVVFKSQEWVMLDEGSITQDEACAVFCDREPAYEKMITKVMDDMHIMLTPMEETVALLYKIKEQGHKLYYLSNYHKKLSTYIQNKYDFFKLFDGGVFSCDIHAVKPNPEIYKHLLDKHNLNPEECVFFDDTAINVDAAQQLGIKGVVFTDAKDVEEYI